MKSRMFLLLVNENSIVFTLVNVIRLCLLLVHEKSNAFTFDE